MSDEPTCKTCPWILYGVLWPQCNNPRAIRDGYQVDPGADSCDEHPGRVLK